MTSKEELEHTLELLRIEMEEDRQLYQEKMKVMSLNFKRDEGYCWYPVAIRDSFYGAGERLTVEVERVSHKDIPNQLQNGKIVKLFSNREDGRHEETEITGVISSVRENLLRIVFFADELPEWSERGKLGVELMFDETSYREMESAVKQVIKAKHNRLSELREILLGFRKASWYQETGLPVKVDMLNDTQNQALENIHLSADIAIIHGPPGTGKTTTLVEAIIHTLKEESQVLVCAPSNTAIDLLTEKLARRGIRVLRIGNPARVNEEQLEHTLDVQTSTHKEYKRIKELRKSANELRNMASRYKRNFGRSEREQRKMIQREARKMAEEADAIENYIVGDLLDKAQVITATLVGSSNYIVRDKIYSTVFIDEAAQALEPACWIPILRAERVIFTGDHWQLPPTVKSFDAAKLGLQQTLFEKSILRQQADVMLEVQYRMNARIMEFSNRQFYKGKLQAAASVADQTLPVPEKDIAFPVEFVDTAGTGFAEKTNPKSLSTYNEEEAVLLIQHLKRVCEALNNCSADLKTMVAGIISPYKAQTEILKDLIEKEDFLKSTPLKLSVNTVDGFQGQERDIIYISLVRSNEKGDIGFLGDIRRMNVALTRAKKKLVVFGDSATLSNHPFYKSFLDYIDEIGAYHSAFEFM